MIMIMMMMMMMILMIMTILILMMMMMQVTTLPEPGSILLEQWTVACVTREASSSGKMTVPEIPIYILSP